MSTPDDGQRQLPDAASLVGYRVEAFDGPVGTVDEATVTGGNHLVVHTGKWVFARRHLIPLDSINAVMPGLHRVEVNLTKDDVKHAPVVRPDEWALRNQS